MTIGREAERGQVALYTVLLFPLLMLVLALVLAVGTLEAARTRAAAQLDLAALTATQALDLEALARGEPPRLLPEAAEALAREYLAHNLATLDGLPADPMTIAAAATISVLATGDINPLTGAPTEGPTVVISAVVPTRVPMFNLIGLGPEVEVSVSGSAAARS